MKSLILPKIIFLLSMIYIPKDTLHKIHKIFINFLWRKNNKNIKRETITGSIEDGGIKMVDIHKMNVLSNVAENNYLFMVKMLNVNFYFRKCYPSGSECLLNKN